MSDTFYSSVQSDPIDMRMVAVMRFVLVFSALLIIYIDPSEPDRFVFETYLSLILYSLYSAALYFSIVYRVRIIAPVLKNSHWLDVGWCLLLIGLSSGTNSLFFFFFFFAILHSSFTYGFYSGLKITFVSTAAFTVIGYATSPSGIEFELNRFLIRPTYLLVLGYMVAYWGGYEIRTKRRLALLREIVKLSNPRFGADRTIGVTIRLLRDFYNANGCLLIITDADSEDFTVYRADRNNDESDVQTYSVTPEAAEKLFPMPVNYAAVFETQRRRLFGGKSNCYVFDVETRQPVKENRENFAAVAERLETASYLTVPIYFRGEAVGRIFIYSQSPTSFDQSEIDFLMQAVDQFMPLIENIRLVDHLASDAAEEERKKIARDIHDSIVQPYIGLQLGIDSIEHLLTADDKEFTAKEEVLRKRIRKLRELTEKGIDDLRGYISGLSKARGSESSLLPAIRRYGERFTNATGIDVAIETEENIQIADRLAAEIFQIVAEGLSNIRRHTDSKKALITLTNYKGKIFLAIVNNNDDNDIIQFTPRSISGRVKALGGFLEVRKETGKTAVRVEIPL